MLDNIIKKSNLKRIKEIEKRKINTKKLNEKLVAVVPIRKGSQRVKKQNFREFSGENLLIHKINLLKKLNGIDDIIINTDSDDAISISKK